jgi:hypothetical protein
MRVPPMIWMTRMTCRQETRVRWATMKKPIANSKSGDGDRSARRPLFLVRC